MSSLDSASRARLRLIYPDIATRVLRLIEDMDRIHQARMRVTEAIRTLEYQAALYAKGRRFIPADGAPPLEPGTLPMQKIAGRWELVEPAKRVTNSPPGFSIHHFGLAIDCCFATIAGLKCHPYLEKDPRALVLWPAFGKLAQGHGLIWGGDWNGNGTVDPNDFDRPHVQGTYGFRVQELRDLFGRAGMESVWRAIDRIRQVPEGQDWYGPVTKQRLLELGFLD